jgi:hypothetical protein
MRMQQPDVQRWMIGTTSHARRLVVALSSVSLVLLLLGGTCAEPARAAVQNLPAAVGVVGTPLTPVPTVDVTGLVAPLSFTVNPALPVGLSLDSGTAGSAATGTISGTPTVASPATVYTVTVTDSSPVTALVRTSDVTITVDGSLTPPPSVTALLGQPIAVAPPFLVHGLGSPVTFSAPSAPAWLRISASGVMSGTPDTVMSMSTISITATDAVGAKASGFFNLEVVPALAPAAQAVVGVVGTALSASTYGYPASPTLGYTISPSISTLTGLVFDSTNGAISGSPSHPLGPTLFTLQQWDTTTNAVLAEGVLSARVDAVLTAPSSSVTGAVGSSIISFLGYGATAATAAGLVAPFTYSTVPPLPGLSSPGDLTINPTTGAIAGRPTTATAGTPYTVTVTDKNGARASGAITVTITGQILPLTQSLAGTVGATIASKALTVNGMTAPVTYAISPALPLGLQFSVSTGVVSGIPRAVQTVSTYEVSGADANGAIGKAKLTLVIGRALLSPPTIGSVVGGPTAGSIRVNFIPPMLAPTQQSYTVNVYDSAGVSLVASVEATSSPVVVDGLTPGESYQVVVVADATASFDQVESLPKTGVASLMSSANAATSSPQAGTIVATAATALSRAGIFLAVGAQVTGAKRVLARGMPRRRIDKAPVVLIPLNSYTRIVVPGVTSTDLLQVRIRLAGTWTPLGTARPNARHRLKLPVFAVRNAGTYPIQIASAGRTLFVTVVVKDSGAGSGNG